MEYQTCSMLTAGPLSAAAQTVMTALRAQYAGGIDRKPHSESADSFGKAPSLSQNRGTFNNTQESHTQNKRLHEQSERQLSKQSSAGEMKLPSQCDLQQLHNRDNTFNPWEADKQGAGRSRGYANEGKLSGFNSGISIPWLSRSPPEPYPQGEEFFPRNDLVNRGAQQTVMGFPETHGRISPASIEYSEAEVMAHTPPVKRWRFGNLQIPILSCSKQFEEDDSGQKRQGVDPKKNFNNMPFWSFNEKHLVSGETEVDQNPYGERTEKFQFNSVMFGGAHTEMEECSKSQEYHGCLKETPTSRDASQKISHVLAESCRDSATHKMLTHGGHLPVYDTLGSVKTTDFDQCTEGNEKRSAVETASATEEHVCLHADLYVRQFNIKNYQVESQERSVEPMHSAAFEVTEARQDPKSFSEVGQRGSKVGCVKNMTASAKQSLKWQPPRSSHASSQITLAQELQPPATSSSNKDAKVPITHQAQQSKSTKQLLYTPKTIRNQDNMPIKTTPLKEQESNVMVISNISEAAQQTQFASEVNEHIQLEMDRDEDKTSETAKHTLAFISDPRVCDARHLSQEERMGVLQEAAAARALAATMVYRDGTTQLDPEQKCPPAVCGVLVLLKKSLNSLVLEETGAAEERLLFLSLEQRPVWAQHDLKLQQDLFTSEMLMTMLCGTQVLVCYKSKDLLRTVLRHFSKDLSWKQVNSCQVLDPQIAAWLLDPADSASCFQDLFKKYCTPPTTPTPEQAESRNKKGAHVISSLSRLHRVMVELRNKLETQGLWQLYICMEQKMIPVLAAMESHMIHVDSDALKKTSEMLGVTESVCTFMEKGRKSKMKQLEQEAHQNAGQKFLVSSSSQLRLVLFEKLRLHERCENKRLPRTMLKQQQSTSEAALLQLQDLHPLPKIILEYRQVHKIKSTFLDGILSCMMKTFISSTWNQTSTVSGRLSAKHPNFQALPRQPMQISKTQPTKGEEAELVTVHPRAMFIPREGWTFVSADFCQVELRLLAHLSSDPELLRICQNPEADFFNMLASQWKGISEDSVSAEDREQAKRIVYSVVYGAGKERLSGILGVSAEEASRFQDRFLQKYNKVQTFIQCTVQHCHKYGYVTSIMGRRRSLPHIHSSDWGIRNQAERQAVNFVVQGSAADLCKMAMIHICSLVASSTTLTGRLVAQIHDELLFEVEDSQVEDFAALVRETMESLQRISCLGVSLSVPLKVSVSTGRSWGSMCEVALPHAASTYTTV